jgi:hypothetical protein
MNINDKIQNVELLTETLGKFPSFHDAEVLRVTFEREHREAKGPTMESLIRVLVFQSGKMASYDVNLIFTGLFGLKFENFNHQNVLGNLYITDFSKDHLDRLRGDYRLLGLVKQQQIDGLVFYVKFEYCYGIEAEFLCESVIVDSVTPVDNPST